LEGYVSYLAAYQLYTDKLASLKATYWEAAKLATSEQKDAAKQKCVIKVTRSVVPSEAKVLAFNNGRPTVVGLPSSSVEISRKVVPQVLTPPTPVGDKAATLKAKRRRYRKNRHLRRVKEHAELTKWEIRLRQNAVKMAKYPIQFGALPSAKPAYGSAGGQAATKGKQPERKVEVPNPVQIKPPVVSSNEKLVPFLEPIASGVGSSVSADLARSVASSETPVSPALVRKPRSKANSGKGFESEKLMLEYCLQHWRELKKDKNANLKMKDRQHILKHQHALPGIRLVLRQYLSEAAEGRGVP
jgi:hypothetical protein